MCSVVSDSLRPRGLWPARLLYLWNFPRKNTGVGCHVVFLHRNLPYPEIGPESPALAGKFFTTEPPGKPRSTSLNVLLSPPYLCFFLPLFIHAVIKQTFGACYVADTVLGEKTALIPPLLKQRPYWERLELIK